MSQPPEHIIDIEQLKTWAINRARDELVAAHRDEYLEAYQRYLDRLIEEAKKNNPNAAVSQ